MQFKRHWWKIVNFSVDYDKSIISVDFNRNFTILLPTTFSKQKILHMHGKLLLKYVFFIHYCNYKIKVVACNWHFTLLSVLYIIYMTINLFWKLLNQSSEEIRFDHLDTLIRLRIWKKEKREKSFKMFYSH